MEREHSAFARAKAGRASTRQPSRPSGMDRSDRTFLPVSPGEMKVRSGGKKLTLQKFDAVKALEKFWHITPKTPKVPMKTFGPDKGELHYNDGSGTVGTFDNIVVSLIRLTNPNTGAVSIQMSLEYLATSHGSRTPDGRSLPGATNSYNPGHEEYRIVHTVYFRNSAGGLVFTWALGRTFELICGWNRRHCVHGRIETNILDWFDAVDEYGWEIAGNCYRC